MQRFETIAGQRGKGSCGFQTIKLKPGRPRKSRKSLYVMAAGEVPGTLVPVTDDHHSKLAFHYALRQA
jgi:hypothetical protein